MPRYKIIVEYDGSDFFGWQKQLEQISVQQVIEQAILKFSNEQANVVCSGRTDTGVHGIGQVAHFDLNKIWPAKEVQNAVNFHVKPHKCAILNCEIVSQEFHARFSAIRRYYKYRIINRFAPIILEENRAWHIKKELNIEEMITASQFLIGSHDFTSFRAAFCQANSPQKTIEDIKIISSGQNIDIYIAAPSFLYHMVRNIVGSLVYVGLGKWPSYKMKEVLEAKNRCLAGPTAPAQGLYFLKVDY